MNEIKFEWDEKNQNWMIWKKSNLNEMNKIKFEFHGKEKRFKLYEKKMDLNYMKTFGFELYENFDFESDEKN